MFGFGFSELIVIICVVIILINPKDFPKLAKKAGSIYEYCMRHINGFKKNLKKFEEEIEMYSKLEDESNNSSSQNNEK